MTHSLPARVIGSVAALGLGAALVVGVAGGGTLELGGWHLAIRQPSRALIAGLSCAMAFLVWSATRGGDARPIARFIDAAADLAFWTLCVAIAGMWLAYRVGACGGLDSYAYVSTAHAFASGTLRIDEPLGGILPFAQGLSAAAPPGWLPDPNGRQILPEFAPGLPLVMAVFLRLFGDGGPFWVSPVLAGLAMAMAHGIGKAVGGRETARLGAVLVGVHPVFVTQAIQPMSDVAAVAWLLAMMFCLTADPPRPVLAGVCAVLAIWTRPPLMLPCLVAVLIPVGPQAWSTRARFVVPVLAGIGALAAWQWHLYGSPVLSGRGPAGNLFQLQRVPENLTNYVWWFSVIHTPLIYVAIAAAFWWMRQFRRMFWIFIAIFAVEAAPYLAYLKFPEWETLRYWLPGIPFLLIVAAAGLVTLVARRLRGVSLSTTVVAAAWLTALASFALLRTTATFQLWQSEARFPLLAQVVALYARPQDVVLADVHSGSIRFYGHRPTLRWQAIPATELTATIQSLARDGRRTLLVLDDWVEEAMFRKQFASVLPGVTVASEWRVRGMRIQALAVKGPAD